MNYKKRFLEIFHFLHTYQDVWQREVLHRHPRSFSNPLELWIDEINSWSAKEKIALENHYLPPSHASQDIQDFYAKIRQLMEVEKWTPKNKQAAILHNNHIRLTAKKRHELHCLHESIASNNICYQKLIDIGGGVGHLGQYFYTQGTKSILSLDQDIELQNRGRQRLRKHNPKALDHIHFQEVKIDEKTFHNSQLKVDGHDLVLGLHSCGPLSTHLVEMAGTAGSPPLVNIGCCYLRMKDEYNISQIAKDSGLKLHRHALSLASRGHRQVCSEDVSYRKKVKLYRYGLHLFLQEQGHQEFVAVGSAHKSEYHMLFSHYVRSRLSNRSDLLKGWSDQELDSFLTQKRKEQIERMISKVVFRFAFARLLELYIVLDRVLYLEEKNKKVQLLEIFNPQISPRNLAIFCT